MSLVIRHTQYHLYGQIYSPLLILLTAISLLLAGTWLAFNQPPRLDPYAPISLADKFLYPLEFNAFQRLPKISGKLNNVFALPGSDLVWAVGDDGLIIHTPDGGKTWNKQTFPENSQYQPVEQSDQQQTQKHSFLDIIIPPSLAAEAPAERKKTLAQKKQGEQQEKSTPTLVDKQDENQKHGKIPVLYSVFFIDAELGWIAGENGTILHTENSGKTWQIQNSGQNTLLRAITFVDNQHGWAVGDTGKILHFDKLGKWRERDSKVGNDLHAVTFLDQKQGWAVGSAGTIVHTKNGGKDWHEQTSNSNIQTINSNPTLVSIAFINDKLGWSLGLGTSNEVILYTEDGGKTPWKQIESYNLNWPDSFSSTNAQHGWAAGDYNSVYHPKFDGAQEVFPFDSSRGVIISVAFADERRGWAVMDDGTIWHTKDGSANWQRQSIGKRDSLYSVSFANNEKGWSVGDNGKEEKRHPEQSKRIQT